MLSEISQTKTNTAWHHLYVEPKKMQQISEYNNNNNNKKSRLTDTESKLVVTSGERERRAIQGQRNKKLRGTNYQVKNKQCCA